MSTIDVLGAGSASSPADYALPDDEPGQLAVLSEGTTRYLAARLGATAFTWRSDEPSCHRRVVGASSDGAAVELQVKAIALARDGSLLMAVQAGTLWWLDRAAPAARTCLLYTSPSPRDRQKSRMPSSA